jgi:protein tyrosine/serine phosphatase
MTVPADRKRAWRELYLGDHQFLRQNFRNLHRVGPLLWRGNQPSPGQLKRYRDEMGITTILNLRGASPKGHYVLEAEACERLGLKLINFQCYSREWIPAERWFEAKAILEGLTGPTLMHCKSGADRAGIIAVFYQLVVMGRPYAEARRQLSWDYLHADIGKTGVLDAGFDVYEAWCAARSYEPGRDTFLHWLATDYDPVAIKRDYVATWWGTLLTDRILRRE